MESQIWCPPASSVGRGLRKGAMASANTCVWDKAEPQPSLWCQTIHPRPHTCLWCLSICCPCSGAQRELSLSKSRCGPFKRNCLGIQKLQSPLVFTARSYGAISSWHRNPGLRVLVWEWDLLLLRHPSWFLSSTCGHGSSPFHVSSLNMVSSLAS